MGVDRGPGSPARLPIALTLGWVLFLSMLTAPVASAAEQQDELVLTMAATGNEATVVQGTLRGAPNMTYTVSLYNPPTCADPIPMDPFGSFGLTTDSSGYAAFTAAVDHPVNPGSGVVVKIPTDQSDCVTVVSDTTPPAVSMGALPTFIASTSIPVAWQGSDDSGVRFHVLFRQAAVNEVFGEEQALLLDTTLTSVVFSGKPGRTYCFRTLARDLLNNTSSTGEECTAVHVDDASMKHRKGFKQRKGGDHFMGTFSSAKRKGARLILSGVQADQLAVLIDRCKRCGKIRITFPGVKRRVSLKGPKDTQILVSLADLPSRTPGTLRLTSLSDRPVRVDGVGVSAA